MRTSVEQADLPRRTWRALLCRLGLTAHAYHRREEFFPGRRKQTATRPADPPGWGYVLTWVECEACLRQQRIGARECWEWDYVDGLAHGGAR